VTDIRPLATTRDAEAEWDAYVEAHPRAAVYHLSAFRGFVEAATGHRARYLTARRGGAIVGVVPLVELKSLIFGHYFVGLPYFNHCGILADDDEAARALAEAAATEARNVGASHLELRHLGPASLDWPVKTHKDEMFLALPDTPDALMAGFKSKLRSQIKRPMKDGVTARVGRGELLDAFYDVFAANMRDLGTPVYSRRFFAELFARFADRLWIVVCDLGPTPVAAGVLIGWRDTLEIPWASSLREHNKLSPNMLLYWTALKHAVERGFQRFDFGRSTPGEGTWKFKQQWGAEPVPLHWYYWLRDGGELPALNPDNPKYKLAIQVWQRLPLAVTKVVGPHLVKNLP
jgi:FemAB-related protein (PEP-CTERM system-associated)